jgi:phosphoribosyl 1,2-cyclic phosphate phosphodiesterase
MKLHFLGTAAAEGWPAVFCRCDACQRARELGGKNIRTRAGAIVNDTLKIDFGPDTYMQAFRDSVDLSRIEHVVITHTHHDHLLSADLDMFLPPYAWDNVGTLHIYGNEKAIHQISQSIQSSPDAKDRIRLHLVSPQQTFTAADCYITPLLADHDPHETCLIYLFEHGGRRLLWGHDSGYFPTATWDWLEQNAAKKGPLSVAVLDCTLGPLAGMRGHMGIDGVLAVQEEMMRRNIADDSTLFIATHFSHNGKLMHHELQERLNPSGIEVAFDGWILEF